VIVNLGLIDIRGTQVSSMRPDKNSPPNTPAPNSVGLNGSDLGGPLRMLYAVLIRILGVVLSNDIG
jgi:hypothetical protein